MAKRNYSGLELMSRKAIEKILEDIFIDPIGYNDNGRVRFDDDSRKNIVKQEEIARQAILSKLPKGKKLWFDSASSEDDFFYSRKKSILGNVPKGGMRFKKIKQVWRASGYINTFWIKEFESLEGKKGLVIKDLDPWGIEDVILILEK